MDPANSAGSLTVFHDERTVINDGVRLRLFYVLLGIGCLAHELQLIVRQYQWAGSFLRHFDLWEEVSPVFTALPSVIGLVMHVAIIILSIALILSRRQQAIISLLAVIVVLSLFTIAPPGISNHYIVAAFALVSAVSFNLLSRFAVKAQDISVAQSDAESSDAEFCTAMKHLFTITYFFAAFHKVNTEWFDVTKTAVREFMVPYVTPLISLMPESSVDLVHAAVVVGVYSTVAIEFSLPFLLLWPTTRTVGCLLGVAFNVIIMAQGVVDYPAIVLSFFPLFFTEAELCSLLSRLFSNVTVARVGLASLLWMYLYICSPGGVLTSGWRLVLFPSGYALIVFGDSLLRYGLVFAWVYIGCTIAQELLEEMLLKARSTIRIAYDHNS